MTGWATLSALAAAWATLLISGPPAFAEASPSCVKDALNRTVGHFSATGSKIDEAGELVEFKQEFEVRDVSDDLLHYLVDDVVVAHVSLKGQLYTMVTVNENGEPVHEPIVMDFQCDFPPRSGDVQLVEEWITPSGTDGLPWQYRQTKLIGEDRFEVTLVGRESTSNLPYIVLNSFEAVRKTSDQPVTGG